jgi:hypothetical protein
MINTKIDDNYFLDIILEQFENSIGEYKAIKQYTRDDFGFQKIYTIEQVQTAANEIVEYLSMDGYTPIINLCLLPDNVAGRTNLNDSYFINIDLDKEQFEKHTYTPTQVIAILVHEICHKFLWIHGFKETSDSIEYMTDACAIYVGFGKILYDACERTTYNFENMHHVIRFRTLGYLTKEQIAYLYSLTFQTSIEESNNILIIVIITAIAFWGLGKLLINIIL